MFSCYLFFVLSMILTAILAFAVGVLIGYLVFYMRYENRDVVIELRNNLKDLNRELSELSLEHEEHKQQNFILKDKVSDLFTKNDDLVGVVSELSRYYFNIKVWAEKIQELNKYLKLPDSWIEEKVQKYSAMYQSTPQTLEKDTPSSGTISSEFF